MGRRGAVLGGRRPRRQGALHGQGARGYPEYTPRHPGELSRRRLRGAARVLEPISPASAEGGWLSLTRGTPLRDKQKEGALDDSKAQVGRIPPLFPQEGSLDRQTSQPGHVCLARGGGAPRTRSPVLQTALTLHEEDRWRSTARRHRRKLKGRCTSGSAES